VWYIENSEISKDDNGLTFVFWPNAIDNPGDARYTLDNGTDVSMYHVRWDGSQHQGKNHPVVLHATANDEDVTGDLPIHLLTLREAE